MPRWRLRIAARVPDATTTCAISQALNAFTTVDLSAFYNDISKDRLYTFAARSRERRSAQSAMYLMADGLTRLMAPILSFTSDELWRYLPGGATESVHMAVFPTAAELEPLIDTDLLDRWERLIDLREQVLAEIEPLRKDKRIGSSLQARVVISAPEAELAFLERLRAGSADVVHRLRGRTATGRGRRWHTPPRVDDRTRCRREMRALLEVRPVGVGRACIGRAVRALPGCAGGNGQWLKR